MDIGSLGLILKRTKCCLDRKRPKSAPLARFCPLELVLAIFIKINCHFILHSSENKLKSAEALVFTFLAIKIIFFRLIIKKNILMSKYSFKFSKERGKPYSDTNMAKYYPKIN